ncbi:1051_t:CDS:2 [Racocetra fulgida]|uniref:Pheromone-processing carboxypeptidase KEX1 n=1 Tax=Racocetra fulgida TaxID=60492 RepID=A0A9N8VN16_9GLOM|nr:1051_t:CDS:2 [Racocetra fulgida]
MDGLFLENGPWRMNSDQSLRIIDGSWIEFANVLYVDQPVGTGFSYVNSTGYLRNVSQRTDVVKAIHAERKNEDWVECSPAVSRGFTNDPNLICNLEGTEAMIKELEWNEAKGFQNSTTTPLSFNNTVYGHMISERNLTYVVLYNASHMAPYDVPVESMDMMYRFMGVKPQTIMLPSGTTYNLVIETPLFQSDNVDHFGDSEDEDNGHGQIVESSMRNNQDRYVDDEQDRYVDDEKQGRYVDDEKQGRYVDNEEDYDRGK